jgi:NADH-quinone oxidoreductase subunit E
LCTFKQTARVLAGLPDPERAAAQTGPGEATLAGLRVARERGMEAPDVEAATDSHSGPDDEKVAKESTRNQAAPDPAASVPPEPKEPETDPDATESKT